LKLRETIKKLREEKTVAFTKINKRFRRKIAIPKIGG
jgi:hypothetical protein